MSETGEWAIRLHRGADTRAAILRAGAAIGSEEGLEPLTIGRLAGELGISKSGLFRHFRSKEALQLAIVEEARQVYVREVYRPALARPPGLQRLWAFCEATLSYLERAVFPGGCFFSAAIAEFDARPGAVRDALVVVRENRRDTLERLVGEAQALGEMNAGEDARQLAYELEALLFSAGAQARMPGRDELLARTHRALWRMLGAAGADLGRLGAADGGRAAT
jgi:AcrR family transcriptional regulator